MGGIPWVCHTGRSQSPGRERVGSADLCKKLAPTVEVYPLEEASRAIIELQRWSVRGAEALWVEALWVAK